MNKKAKLNDLIMSNVVYFILTALFVIGLSVFVFGQMNGSGVWEEFYAKEIVKVINLAEPGDEITLDVHRGTVIAKENEVRSYSDMFRIDNANNEICVRLSSSRRTCYSYFNDVDVMDWKVELGVGKNGGNILSFKVVEVKRNE